MTQLEMNSSIYRIVSAFDGNTGAATNNEWCYVIISSPKIPRRHAVFWRQAVFWIKVSGEGSGNYYLEKPDGNYYLKKSDGDAFRVLIENIDQTILEVKVYLEYP